MSLDRKVMTRPPPLTKALVIAPAVYTALDAVQQLWR
jgi:hypothetical protein